jgi:acetylornithine deacetylase/succinyl-diaminopimelate desuccinylase-like protein
MPAVTDYITKNRQRYVDELFELLRMPTVSADSTKKQELIRCAEHLVRHFAAIGLTAKLVKTPGHPIVYAEWLGRPGAPTVLYYGHYDVQPADPLELWKTPPFEPTIKGGNVYARGSSDDKGQFFLHVKAAEAHFKAGDGPPVNIKFIIEGEEEAAADNLEKYIADNTKLLACDHIIVSDTAQFDQGCPSICYGLRGIVYMEIIVTGPNRDLHSGEFGGTVANPANVLGRMISRLHDDNGRVQIDGFYNDVVELSTAEKAEFARLPFDPEKYRKSLDLPQLFGEKGYTDLERVWARPTCDVNGIYGGYMGEGGKTIIPAKAGAKISMRLVPDQDPETIERQFIAYIKKITPPSVRVEIITHGKARPVVVPTDSPALTKAREALRKAYGTEAVLMRGGGSIPVVETFKRELGVPAVLLGFGLPDDALHSPNEKMSLEQFHRGILTSAYLMELLAE